MSQIIQSISESNVRIGQVYPSLTELLVIFRVYIASVKACLCSNNWDRDYGVRGREESMY